MSTPRVAVCVPVYRNAAHLALTLESVLAQTFQDWELVAVDDHSDDGSFEIAQSFAARDPRITVHRNEANLGPAANWTRSVELTSARATVPTAATAIRARRGRVFMRF